MTDHIWAAAAAIAFVLLAGVGIWVLLAARKTLLRLDAALLRMQAQVEETAAQSRGLMTQTSELATGLQTKLKSLDRLTASLDELSGGVQLTGRTLKHLSSAVTESVLDVRQAVHTNQNAIAEIVELTTSGFQLWQRWQARRQSVQQGDE